MGEPETATLSEMHAARTVARAGHGALVTPWITRTVTGKEQYGDRYWCVGLGDGTEVHAHADEVRVEPSGALLLVRGSRAEKPEQVNLASASGQWRFVFAASLLDGHAVAAVHWPGQIVEADPDAWAT